MSPNNPNFTDMIKVYPIPIKQKPRPFNNKNFEEFRTVYSEKKLSSKSSSQMSSSVRPLSDLKTIKLEIPVLGSEKAIVRLPSLKKNAVIKSCLKKTPVMPTKTSTTQELLKKLKKMETGQSKKLDSLKVTKRPSLNLIENTNKEIDLAVVQLEQIRELLQKKQQTANSQPKSAMYKINKRNSTRARHGNCYNSKYTSTLTSLQNKVKILEDKYFSKPQIVYKSINDNFTQSSDIKILYENKGYPEDLKMDQTLRGIIDELDDMVNVNIEEELLSSLNLDVSSVESVSKSESIRSDNAYQSDFTTSFKLSSKIDKLSLDKAAFSNNLDHLFKFGRKSVENNNVPSKQFPKNSNLTKRDYVSKKNTSVKPVENRSVSSLTSTRGTKRVKKKVTFVDAIPEDSCVNQIEKSTNTSNEPNLLQGKTECERIVDQMYRDSFSSFGVPSDGEDSIFALLDDTKVTLDEFLRVEEMKKDRNNDQQNMFQNSIKDINEFVKSKKRHDERKEDLCKLDSEILNIINKAKSYGISSGDVQKSVVVDKDLKKDINSEKSSRVYTKEEAVQLEDNYSNIIDSSEALVKKFSNIKGKVFAVGEFCDNLSRITESDEEDEEVKQYSRPLSTIDGSGDERDSLETEEEEEKELLKMVNKSSFLMKEFNLVPKVKIFTQSDSGMYNRQKSREEAHTSGNRSGIDITSLQKNVNLALENSIFSTLEN